MNILNKPTRKQPENYSVRSEISLSRQLSQQQSKSCQDLTKNPEKAYLVKYLRLTSPSSNQQLLKQHSISYQM